MPVPPFPQTREAELLSWSTSYNELINIAPANYGLTVAQAGAYTLLHDAFAAAYATATNPATNSKTNIEIKNNAKQNLLHGANGAWQLVNINQSFPGMNNDMRSQLNIRIPDTDPTPVPVPSESPDLDVISTFGHTVKLRVHDSSKSLRGKPPGVKGCSVFHFIGDNPPNEVSAWSFAGNTTKSVYDVVLPSETPAGAKVWITAFWFNNKMQSGPAAVPVSIHVPGGLSVAA